MKRIEILQEICNRDTNKSLEDSQLGLMWVADAIEAMKRYGEFCYNAGMLEKETEKEWEGEIAAREFDIFFKEQEEQK